jgi:predicted negative regulator of RcsB-dependent stress response
LSGGSTHPTVPTTPSFHNDRWTNHKFGSDAKKFASERRGDIDAVVKRMNADAVEAEKKLEKLNQAGTQSWSALMAALTETRAAFDRANEAAREAFRRAA